MKSFASQIEQSRNGVLLTKELVDEILSFKPINPYEADPDISNKEYGKQKQDHLDDFIAKIRSEFEQVSLISDNDLALRLILGANHDIYNKIIEDL